MRIPKRIFLLPAALLAALFFSSCASELGYYSQCVGGHLGILARRQPIDKVLADPAASPELKNKLSLVLRIRDYASRELHLPDNGSYRCYVDLQRPKVVWNVVAAPEFSLRPRQWCFPVAGCVTYRGYYDEDDGRAAAEDLRREGNDVHFYGVDAYSTLGWFDDPVLNTFVDSSEARIAELIFHELAHQKLYVKGDSAFNEAFAEEVGREGVVRWLRHEGRLDELARWRESGRREEEFFALLEDARGRLEKLYGSGLGTERMRNGKAQVFRDMERDYLLLKESWGGYDGYDRWFAAPLNNARLASVGTYRNNLPAFEALLRQQDGDLDAFYRQALSLSRLPEDERRARMEDLAAAGRRTSPDIARLRAVSPGSDPLLSPR